MNLTLSNIRALEASGDKPGLKVSIYIPTHRHSTADGIAQDRIRLKNSLRALETHEGFDKRVLGKTLEKLNEEIENDGGFWREADHGLAVFLADDEYYAVRVPFEVETAEYFLDHFVLAPLILAATSGVAFHVLDVNFTAPRLLHLERGQLVVEDVTDLPESIPARQYFSNHDRSDDRTKNEDERRYLRAIAEAVDAHLEGRTDPLILAGTANRLGPLRPVLTYPHVLEGGLVGNHEATPDQELYDLAAPLAYLELRTRTDDAVAKLLGSAPELRVAGEAAIKQAIAEGRVDTLFIPAYRNTRDKLARTDSLDLVICAPADPAVNEELVRGTFDQGGHVVAVEVDAYPGLEGSAALLRY